MWVNAARNAFLAGTRMRVRHAHRQLERLESDKQYHCGFPENIVKRFRKRMQLIRQARDERDIRAFRSHRFEKLKGKRSHQYSIRLNDQMRLIVEFEGEGQEKVIVITGIEDYH